MCFPELCLATPLIRSALDVHSSLRDRQPAKPPDGGTQNGKRPAREEGGGSPAPRWGCGKAAMRADWAMPFRGTGTSPVVR